MDIVKKYGIFSSSVNPEKLSLTLKGAIPFVVFALPLLGFVDVGESDLVALVDQALLVITGAVTLYGLARKFWAKRV